MRVAARVSFSCATLFFSTYLGAQSISTTVNIAISGFSVSSGGTAQYFCNSISGGCYGETVPYLTGYHKIGNGTTGAEPVRQNFGGPSVMSYSATISGTTAAANCYRAEVSATGNLGGFQRSTSAQACAPPITTDRYAHGYDICPLLLDIRGDGIATSGASQPVAFFDVNGDGIAEPSGWTAPDSDDAFLWLDLNGNHAANHGELFGAGMPLPSGVIARNGFEALRIYDQAAFGGNGDGVIDGQDRVWHRLRLWTDRSHDGVSQPQEIEPLGSAQVVELALAASRAHSSDEYGNLLMFEGRYVKRLVAANGPSQHVERRLDDISFVPLD